MTLVLLLAQARVESEDNWGCEEVDISSSPSGMTESLRPWLEAVWYFPDFCVGVKWRTTRATRGIAIIVKKMVRRMIRKSMVPGCSAGCYCEMEWF